MRAGPTYRVGPVSKIDINKLRNIASAASDDPLEQEHYDPKHLERKQNCPAMLLPDFMHDSHLNQSARAF